MKKLLLLFVALLPIVANAYNAKIDGIYYNFSGNEAKVTFQKYQNKKPYYISDYSGTVVIPSTVTYNGKTYTVTCIGNDAFYGCTSLTSVVIPNSVTSIRNYAFYDCSGLTSITIPNSVTSLGAGAFQSCTGLTSIAIPYSATSIGSYAFSGCNGLTSVTIPNSVTSIGNSAFAECYSQNSATIPNSVTSIGNSAFAECYGLTSVTIGNGVTSIGEKAFYNCRVLTSVTIGSDVYKINSLAFANCQELTDVYCYAENVPSTNINTFQDSYIYYTTLHVPASAIEQYKAREPWSQFGTIVSTDGTVPDPPTPEKCAKPTISYVNGKLKFNCETEGVQFTSTIKDNDIKTFYSDEIDLGVTYTITVYATKEGYEDSEVATATLCWIDVAPQTEGIIDEDAIAEVKAMPVLIQSQGGNISIQGAAEGTPIAVYDIDGRQHGMGFAEKGCATIATSLQAGSIAVVKIGEKSVKVLVK